MASGIDAEMTVTNHTALYRFSFPNSATHPLILADLTDLPKTKQRASVKTDNSTGRISGSGVFRPSFGAASYELYFCADFSGADVRDTGLWINGMKKNSRVVESFELTSE
jgi:putative alpha-1,2-mannosidase